MTNFQNELMLNTSTSPAQSFLFEDAGNIPSARARVLGGGSSLNAGFFTYSSPEYVASMGWDGKLVNESYTWVTPIIADIPVQIFQSTAKAGLLEAGVAPDNGGTFQHLIGTKVGGSIFDHTGRRHTAADLLQYSNPDRTTVLWANTQRVLFDLRNVLSILCRIRHAGSHL
jgi:choline dehydrogenase